MDQFNKKPAPGLQSAQELEGQWQELCDCYLPLSTAESVWRYSRERLPGDPDQGWKLHVSATILTAVRTLRVLGPLLKTSGSLYKAPVSLNEIERLNSGLFYEYSQIGKVITIFPRTTSEAVELAEKVYQLTRRLRGPRVPFDSKYRDDGCVYYRYGAFSLIDVKGDNGELVHAIRHPEGHLVEDKRDGDPRPAWVKDPFVEERPPQSLAPPTPLQTTFRAFSALAQRGRGGVYQAVDLSVSPPRLCLLKEGRRDGEMDWNGRDGYWRVKHEAGVLAELRQKGVGVPATYSTFRAERNYFLALELIEGEDLLTSLTRRQRRLPIKKALRLALQLAGLVSQIHDAGWVWRDCKPNNVVITKAGKLRPVDFEGACRSNDSEPLPWGTGPYLPPEATYSLGGRSRLPEDLYALGSVIYFLLAGRTPESSTPSPLPKLRRNIPREASSLVMALLDCDPRRRPAAEKALETLAPLCE